MQYPALKHCIVQLTVIVAVISAHAYELSFNEDFPYYTLHPKSIFEGETAYLHIIYGMHTTSTPESYVDESYTITKDASQTVPPHYSVQLSAVFRGIFKEGGILPVITYYGPKYQLANLQEGLYTFTHDTVSGSFRVFKSEDIQCTVSTDKEVCVPGDSLIISYCAHNASTAEMNIESRLGRLFDVKIRNGNDSLLDDFADNIEYYSKVPYSLVIAPGESRLYTFPPYMVPASATTLNITVRIGGMNHTEAFGTVAVSGATPCRTIPKQHSPGILSLSGNALFIRLHQPQKVTIEAFRLDGTKYDLLPGKTFLKAGTYRLRLGDCISGNGIVLLRMNGADFSVTKKISLLNR